jgi:hypothetical protein
LPEDERLDLLLEWLRKSIKMAEQIENQFRIDYKPSF